MNRKEWKKIAGFIVLSVLIGSIWLPEQALNGEISSGYIVAVINTIGALVAAVICLLLRVRMPGRREWRSIFFACGGFMTSMAVLYAAEMLPLRLSAVEMTALHATAPLAVALMTPLWFEALVPRRAVLWMLAGFGGILLLLSVALGLSWIGAFDVVFGFIAILCTVTAFLYASRRLRNISPVLLTCVVMSAVALLTWPLALWSGAARPVEWSGPGSVMPPLCVLAGIDFAGLTLGFWLLQRLDPYKLVMVRIAAPVVMMLEAWAFVGGSPGWERVAGMVLAVASVAGVLRLRGDEDASATLFSPDAQPAELH